jgi:hypothetical protein
VNTIRPTITVFVEDLDKLCDDRNRLLEALKAASNDVSMGAALAHARGNQPLFAELTSHLRIYLNAIAEAERGP